MAEITYCEWMTGFPTKFYDFIASFETNSKAVEFHSDAPVEVDWGTGKWLRYEAGVVHGFQANPFKNDPVLIRASEPVTVFRFGSGLDYDPSYLECHIHKAFDLVTAVNLCYRLELMEKFSFFGVNRVTDFTSAWEDCTELIEFEGLDTTRALTFKSAWKNCNKLVEFPSVYSRVCTTVEEAWMGCTSMLEFPVIGVENCLNFDSAWRGNTQLVDFPLIKTGSGISFDHAWAYCISLLDFPVLDYGNAENLSHAFAYNYKNKTLGAFNTKKGIDFTGMFERNIALECITELDTRNIGKTPEGELLSHDMFLDDCNLLAPNATEQAELMVGSYYENTEPCYFDAGRSTFYAVAVSTASQFAPGDGCLTGSSYLCTFTISGIFNIPGKADFEVDWGDGVFLPYNEGTVTGIPIKSGIIHIRSEEDVQKIVFVSDTFIDISIKRGKTLRTCEDMARDKKALLKFSIYGNMISDNYDRMLMNDVNLQSLDTVDYSYAKSMVSTFEGCASIMTMSQKVGVVQVENCIDFTSTFKGCSSITYLPVLVTNSGEIFTDMFKNCLSLECIHGINTEYQTNTQDMFMNTPKLFRPNINERAKIENPGMLYSNGGNCGSPFDMMFVATDPTHFVTFVVDVEVDVDKGTGTYVKEGPGSITFTPTGPCYVSGDVTSIQFVTNTFKDVIFYNADYITDMSLMFAGLNKLQSFNHFGLCVADTWLSAFEGCSDLVNFTNYDYSRGKIYSSMFKSCSSLTNVGYMNTVEGTQFEYMFSGTTSMNKNDPAIGLLEINTIKGQFAKYYISCDPTKFDCRLPVDGGDIVKCGVGDPLGTYSCTEYYHCNPIDHPTDPGDKFPCFAESTMFEFWTPDMVPSEADRIEIMSQAHWKEGEIL